MKRYFISDAKMELIANYMDDEHREEIHRLYAPCSSSEFLYQYVRRFEDINDVLESEFDIYVEDVLLNNKFEVGELVRYKDEIAKVLAVRYLGSLLTDTKYKYDVEVINENEVIYSVDEKELKSLDESIIFKSYQGTWTKFDEITYCGERFKIFENDKYGDDSYCVFTDEFNNPIDATFDDLLTALRNYYG